MYIATKTAAIFLKATESLEKHGWTQDPNKAPDGRLCLVSAVATAFTHDLDCRDFDMACSQLGDLLGSNPVRWNDALGRTKEEVIDALRKAASRHMTMCFR